VKAGSIWRGAQLLVPQAWRADRPWSRARGLLGRSPLRACAAQALWLVPCGGIHTIGMGYALDVVFLDRDGRVLAWHEAVAPWRMRRCRGARQTVELAAGSVAALEPARGEVWQWRTA
jgi:uncharacterized membrane protein (UPF0127 family)